MSLAWATSPMWLVINVLAAFRLTRLWIDDTIPPLPMLRLRLRRWIGRRWEIKVEAVRQHKGVDRYVLADIEQAYDAPPLTYLLDCYWCVGFWVSAGVTVIASAVPPAIWGWVAIPLALSALIGLLGRLD